MSSSGGSAKLSSDSSPGKRDGSPPALPRLGKSLATREQLLADFVDTAGVGLHWVGSDGTILWANPIDYEPLGYAADEYIGHNIAEFHVDLPVIEDILARLTAGERLRDQGARLRCKDGSVRSVVINSSVLFDDEGRFVHTRCFTHDVTERKRLDEAREQFVSILGHDLRNPLSAISIASSALLGAPDLPERHQRSVARIVRSAERMSRMIADLLDFARGRMGEGIPVKRIPTDLASICAQTIEELRMGNADREISLDVSGSTNGEWDPDRVAQVMSNLVGNAIEHGRDPIRVTLRGADDAVRFQVSNRGEPIQAERRGDLFHPFRQSGSQERTGLGLGLFIAREIVRSHGGSIDVKSDDEETVFSVRWPRQP